MLCYEDAWNLYILWLNALLATQFMNPSMVYFHKNIKNILIEYSFYTRIMPATYLSFFKLSSYDKRSQELK